MGLTDPECDICTSFDMNEYPNIFAQMNVLIYLYQKLTQMNVRINICIENFKNIWIYLNIRLVITKPTHSRTNVRIYSYKQILFKYICHTLVWDIKKINVYGHQDKHPVSTFSELQDWSCEGGSLFIKIGCQAVQGMFICSF